MYPTHQPNGSGPPQSNGNAPYPSQWNNQRPNSSQPPNSQYPPPPPQISNSLPPPLTEPRADMAALPPQQQYRLPGPHEMYGAPPPSHHHPAPHHQDYRPPPPQHMTYQQHQPAPRQRTAIACRYCRRRKIRCSGFDQSEDGRCQNCMRFSQECVFTPVAAQTQAFVPAHTVWRGNGQAPQLYGAYGQPLPPPQAQPQSQQDAYGQPRQPAYALPSPTGPYTASGVQYSPSGGYDDRGSRDALHSRKRPNAEPHTPTLPPPNPASASQLTGQRGSGPEYNYPDPTSLTTAAVSPASTVASYQSAPPPAQPYYTTQPGPSRSSPQSTYSYDPSRTSSSPHTQATSSTPGTSTYPGSDYGANGTLRPPASALPLRNDGRTPPPNGTQPLPREGGRAGMRISDMVSDNTPGRSNTDNDMLNALNRGRPR